MPSSHMAFSASRWRKPSTRAGSGSPPRPSYPEACGLRHLAFRVENIDETVQELHARGIETEPIRTDPFTQRRMTFFHDPDDLPLELHE